MPNVSKILENGILVYLILIYKYDSDLSKLPSDLYMYGPDLKMWPIFIKADLDLYIWSMFIYMGQIYTRRPNIIICLT